jgi:hypothetical protein
MRSSRGWLGQKSPGHGFQFRHSQHCSFANPSPSCMFPCLLSVLWLSVQVPGQMPGAEKLPHVALSSSGSMAQWESLQPRTDFFHEELRNLQPPGSPRKPSLICTLFQLPYLAHQDPLWWPSPLTHYWGLFALPLCTVPSHWSALLTFRSHSWGCPHWLLGAPRPPLHVHSPVASSQPRGSAAEGLSPQAQQHSARARDSSLCPRTSHGVRSPGRMASSSCFHAVTPSPSQASTLTPRLRMSLTLGLSPSSA